MVVPTPAFLPLRRETVDTELEGTTMGYQTQPYGPWESLLLSGPKPHHSPEPTICSLPVSREIEFLKKETAQRRVLEESELARKEEMDKLLDKVSPWAAYRVSSMEAGIQYSLNAWCLGRIVVLAGSSGS